MKLFRLFAFALLLAASALSAIGAHAQAPGDVVLGETSVEVPANGEATISFQTFCLEFGKEFPSSLGTPDGRAEDNVIGILKSAIQNGSVDDNPLAAQLAIWSRIEGQSVAELYPDTEIAAAADAQALVDEAEGTTVDPLRTDQGISLTDAVANGTIEATSSDFRFVETDMARPDDRPYHGEGTLVLRNLTDEPVQVYFPIGTVFRASDDSEQDIVTYATQLEQLPTPTAAPTQVPEATPTAAPTPGAMPTTGGDTAPSSNQGLLLVAAGAALVLLASATAVASRPR